VSECDQLLECARLYIPPLRLVPLRATIRLPLRPYSHPRHPDLHARVGSFESAKWSSFLSDFAIQLGVHLNGYNLGS